MLEFIKHIINIILVKYYSKYSDYYNYEVTTIKRVSSNGSFIEYESDDE
tara:strand:+ start:6320 stop:6466 length:147 start_codon:yes stop_codon:yes gene_type:complete